MVTICRIIDLCKILGINVNDHFREVTKMVQLGSGSRNGHWYVYGFCKILGISIDYHFREVTKMIIIDKGIHNILDIYEFLLVFEKRIEHKRR